MTLLLLLLSVSIQAPPGQSPELRFGSPVSGSIEAGRSRTYTFAAEAGDEVAGHAELIGVEGNLQFLNADGQRVEGLKVRQWSLGPAAGRRVGFIAPSAGAYQLRLTNASAGAGTYSLQLEKRAVAARMQGVSVIPTIVSHSERIRQLSRDVEQGRGGTVEQFWREQTGKGPLIEPIKGNDRELLVTFLWRQTYETHNVLVGWPMAAWRADDYYMSRIPNTDVWYKTIQVQRGSRFLYWLSPNHRSDADRLYTDQPDPLNPRLFPEDPNFTVDLASVLETPGAPDDSWARRTPVRRGTVEQKTFTSTLMGNASDFWVYTPPGYAPSAGPYPLIVLFDGASYVRGEFIDALPTLDNLINDGRMRPAVVCFADSLFRRLSAGAPYGEPIVTYGNAIVRELLPQLRATYAITSAAKDTVIGGFSAGGLVASLIAFRHSEVFGNVLAQSGFFRARPPGSAEPTTIAQMFRDAPRLPIRFYLETGLYENMPSARLPLHDLALDEGLTTSNRHFRDVLISKGYEVTYRETGGAHDSVHWRATLADALMTLLKPTQ